MGFTPRFPRVSLAVDQMGANALEVLRSRYLRKKNGQQESPRELAERVALAVAAAEKRDLREGFAEKFFRLIESLRFLPNSPTLMNAGSENARQGE